MQINKISLRRESLRNFYKETRKSSRLWHKIQKFAILLQKVNVKSHERDISILTITFWLRLKLKFKNYHNPPIERLGIQKINLNQDKWRRYHCTITNLDFSSQKEFSYLLKPLQWMGNNTYGSLALSSTVKMSSMCQQLKKLRQRTRNGYSNSCLIIGKNMIYHWI